MTELTREMRGPFVVGGTGRLSTERVCLPSDVAPNGLPWPRVSIVTPSYNQGRFIEETILSVRGQGYPNLEHVVVDGGSVDDTIDILRRYEGTYDLRWTSEPDRGQSDAVNKGFRRAEGEIVGWMNSDDTYMPGTVAAAVRHLVENPHIGWLCGDGVWLDEDSRVLGVKYSGPYTFQDLVWRGMYLTQPSLFIRRGALETVGPLDVDMHTAMDYDFCLRLGRVHAGGYLPAILATRRLHGQAKTARMSTSFARDALRALDKLFSDPNLPEDIRAVRHKAYARRYLIGGHQAFCARQFPEARRLLMRSVMQDPSPWRLESVISLILVLESVLGITWMAPGAARRRTERAFRAKHGDVSVKWVAGS